MMLPHERIEQREAAQWLKRRGPTVEADGRMVYLTNKGQRVRLTPENTDRWLKELSADFQRAFPVPFRWHVPTAAEMAFNHSPAGIAARRERMRMDARRASLMDASLLAFGATLGKL
jgi:hypothetical protein